MTNKEFGEIEFLTDKNFGDLIATKPEEADTNLFLYFALKDSLKMKTARELRISNGRTVAHRVRETLKTLRSYPYFQDTNFQAYLNKDGEEYQIAAEPRELKNKIQGEKVLDFKLADKVSIIIEPKKPFGDYEKWFLTQYLDTLDLQIKNAISYEENSLLSRTDFLTGLKNRRSFDEDLKSIYLTGLEKRSEEKTEGTSLILIDLDNLKKTNDIHPLGHLAGDTLLKGAGKLLILSMIKPSDNVYRLGGDEFAVIMPTSKLETALKIAERIRYNIEKQNFAPLDKEGLFSTASLGVSNSINAQLGIEEFFMSADQALRKAKETKNKVVCLHSL